MERVPVLINEHGKGPIALCLDRLRERHASVLRRRRVADELHSAATSTTRIRRPPESRSNEDVRDTTKPRSALLALPERAPLRLEGVTLPLQRSTLRSTHLLGQLHHTRIELGLIHRCLQMNQAAVPKTASPATKPPTTYGQVLGPSAT